MPADPLIVALDVDSASAAVDIVDRLGEAASFYKVGLELFSATGPDFIEELVVRRKQVFVDLKLFDIPETVRRATAQIARTGATLFTVHGSSPVMSAAIEASKGTQLKILAVTVLTSFDQEDLTDFGIDRAMHDVISLRVSKALEVGVAGVVCSPHEAAAIRRESAGRLTVVTPGVRSSGSEPGDQKRVTTPFEAISNGADYIVVGRQVTRAADPLQSLLAIRQEIEPALASIASR